MAPTVYGLDSAELTTGAYWLGIVHAPGSPLYLLIGHLFTWLPIGDVGYRLNLMSACAVALAAFFVYHTLLHLTQHRFVSLLSAWYLAFTYYFWINGLFAELYGLQACLVAGLILLALKWREQGHSWQLYTLTFFLGLSTGNHLSLVLLGPGFVWLVLSALSQPRRKIRLLLTAASWGVVGTLIYLYLPLRYLSDTPINYARHWPINLATWTGFWWMVTGRMFESLFFSVPIQNLPTELGHYLYQLWSNFAGLGFVIGLVGLITDFKSRLSFHSSLSMMFGGHLLFYLSYGASDKELMFLPTFLIWGLWFGLGVAYILRQINQRLPETYHYLGICLLILMVFSNLTLNFDYVDLSQYWSARELGENILAEIEPNAIFLGTWRDVPILEYLQLVEGQREDVTLINLFFTSPKKARILAYKKLQIGQPVYTSTSKTLYSPRFNFSYIKTCGCSQVTWAEE